MKRILVLSFFILSASLAFGQDASTPNCAQTLRLARATYEQGRLHEIEKQLEECLKSGFTREQKQLKVEGYKILCLSYIYLEEPEKADEAMLNILRTDPYFQINPAVDPAEFVALYRSFRTDPVFRIGAKVGPNYTMVNTIKNYYVLGNSAGNGKYKPGVGFSATLSFEKDFGKKFVLNPELSFTTQNFTYQNSGLISNDSLDKASSQENKITQKWVNLNLLAQYKIGKSALTPYVAFGPSISYMLNSSFLGETNVDGGDNVSGASIDNTSSFNKINLSLVLSGGFRYRIGSIYVAADLRYVHGLLNVVDGSKRYENTKENNQLIYEYGYINNDFSLRSFMLNVGVVYPYFKPKKLIKKS